MLYTLYFTKQNRPTQNLLWKRFNDVSICQINILQVLMMMQNVPFKKLNNRTLIWLSWLYKLHSGFIVRRFKFMKWNLIGKSKRILISIRCKERVKKYTARTAIFNISNVLANFNLCITMQHVNFLSIVVYVFAESLLVLLEVCWFIFFHIFNHGNVVAFVRLLLFLFPCFSSSFSLR